MNMANAALMILATLLVAAGLWPALRNFDRKMVAAGQRRRLAEEAKSTAPPLPGCVARISALGAANGPVEYAIQLEGDATVYHLTLEQSIPSGDAASGARVTCHILPGLPPIPHLRAAASA